jgi:nucleolar GTP-binding protein
MSQNQTFFNPEIHLHLMFKEVPPFTSQEIIDVSFRKSSKKGKNELEKISIAADTISSMLDKIIKRYPSFEHMNIFQRELIDVIVGEDTLKHNLGALQWASNTVQKIKREYLQKIRRNKKHALPLQKQCYARYVSVLKQIKENMAFLINARTQLIGLPAVDSQLFTVVLAGLPNVGKTSVLHALTGSEPEIQPYPFTTQGINVGYIEHQYSRIQVVDTPGLLDRPFSQRNKIEKQAISALTHVADIIVYIFDISETCGYSVNEQKHLLHDITQFGLPVIVVNNKSDIQNSEYTNISSTSGKGITQLKKEIEHYFLAAVQKNHF